MEKPLCKIEDCPNPSLNRGWCRAHYLRWYKTGDPLKIRPGKWDGYVRPTCKADGCEVLAHGRGYCISHLKRLDRHGDPFAGRRNNGPRDVVERFWHYVDLRGDDECWPWTGSVYTVGYGEFSFGGSSGYAHRFSYELHKGPIPVGLTIDHTCHNADYSCPGGKCAHRLCINPAHLEAVTTGENVRRGYERKRKAAG